MSQNSTQHVSVASGSEFLVLPVIYKCLCMKRTQFYRATQIQPKSDRIYNIYKNFSELKKKSGGRLLVCALLIAEIVVRNFLLGLRRF